jgi:putative membrane protein
MLCKRNPDFSVSYAQYPLMALFWIVVILLAVWLLSNLFPKNQTSPVTGAESPLAILQQRYARGEISKEEYETIRQDLER